MEKVTVFFSGENREFVFFPTTTFIDYLIQFGIPEVQALFRMRGRKKTNTEKKLVEQYLTAEERKMIAIAKKTIWISEDAENNARTAQNRWKALVLFAILVDYANNGVYTHLNTIK